MKLSVLMWCRGGIFPDIHHRHGITRSLSPHFARNELKADPKGPIGRLRLRAVFGGQGAWGGPDGRRQRGERNRNDG
jgi:hypothetical protein